MFPVAVLWTAFYLVNFNIAMMTPLLPFIERDAGLTTAQAGWLLAAFPVVALASNLTLGPWIDYLGRRRFLMLGGALGTVVLLLTAASNSPGMLIACRAATGLCMPMLGASVFSGIADYVPEPRRAHAVSRVTTGAPIAFLCSMSMGMVLGGLVSWRIPLAATAMIALGIAVAAWRLPPTPAEALSPHAPTLRLYASRFSSVSGGPAMRFLFLGYFGWSCGVFAFMGLYPSWVVQHGLAQQGPAVIGGLLFLGEIGGLLGVLLAGRIAHRHPRPILACALAAFAMAAVMLAVPFGHGLVVAQALGYGAFAFGRDLMTALVVGAAIQLVAPGQRGSLNAMLNAILQTGGALGGMAGAWLYAASPGFLANAGVAALMLVASGASLLQVGRQPRRAAA